MCMAFNIKMEQTQTQKYKWETSKCEGVSIQELCRTESEYWEDETFYTVTVCAFSHGAIQHVAMVGKYKERVLKWGEGTFSG